jgi:uncharacterized membrane protein
MSIRTPLSISILLLAIMAAASLWGFYAVPDHTQIAVHWDIGGKPNGFLPKDIGLSLLPAIGAALTFLFSFLPSIEPRRANLQASRKLYISGWIGGLAILTLTHFIVVLSAAGRHVDVLSTVLAGVSLLILVVGNFMGKSRSTFLVGGLRTPWSLSSDLAWERTNRMVGRLYVLTGLLTLAALSVEGAQVAIFLFIGGIFSSSAAGICLSYLYWRRDPQRNAGDGSLQ